MKKVYVVYIDKEDDKEILCVLDNLEKVQQICAGYPPNCDFGDCYSYEELILNQENDGY